MENADDYKGMTINEMLFLSGKLNDFNLALKKKDVSELRLLLKVYQFQTTA
jgi:hypothetical protein